jgi:hypothetical protein
MKAKQLDGRRGEASSERGEEAGNDADEGIDFLRCNP